MTKSALLVVLAFLLDTRFGDPVNPLHPVRVIGKAIGAGTGLYRKLNIRNAAAAFALGALLSLNVVALAFFGAWLVLRFLYAYGYWLGFGFELVLCYFIIAARALKTESMSVSRALSENNIALARERLSYIVGRDTKTLERPGIIRAAVETVAENLSDGVIAPMLCIFIGGAPLGLAYKAVNTLDSMLGYHNAEFEYFGKFAARLDDAVNLVPARVSAALMLLSTLFIGDGGGALRVFLRDRYKHKSPNSAQTESVCAGALGIRLGGDNFYGGQLVRKPSIGDDTREPEIPDIAKANRLMYTSAALLLIVLAAVTCVCRIAELF